jgi:hypothetical protein
VNINPADALSLILAALSGGAVAALKETAGQAVKDAYQALKGMVLRKLGDQPAAKEVVERYPAQPEVWEKPLAQLLNESGADRDAALLQAAGRLMALVDPQNDAIGKYRLTITGSPQGLVVGDQANVTMNFGEGAADRQGKSQKKKPARKT